MANVYKHVQWESRNGFDGPHLDTQKIRCASVVTVRLGLGRFGYDDVPSTFRFICIRL